VRKTKTEQQSKNHNKNEKLCKAENNQYSVIYYICTVKLISPPHCWCLLLLFESQHWKICKII